ncbi:MAG: glucose-1-phosphate cytidylyltransferase [Candidatus Eremiobacteraeota bacterium]|nr:glucose-1-phosphate cytidylyltransferase [Candidatus Eremiobacteraeota bacterium]
MKVVILAGGLGTRLAEETELKPKPMVEIGGYPMLWHIMNIYAAAGFTEFVIALGYKGDIIKDYFLNFHARNSDLVVELGKNRVRYGTRRVPEWTVHLVDTGLDTLTGGRILALREVLGGERFMVTYGDGLARIDVRDLLTFHERAGKTATLTAVRPAARFGSLQLDESQIVKSFLEKPQMGEGWINGGFFVFEPAIFDYITNRFTPLERAPLERLAAKSELAAYPLEGFWQPMDTLREKRLLEELWQSGNAPWKVWNE